MALSLGSMEGDIMSALQGRNIATGGDHGKAWVAPRAIADGVVTAITSTAAVVVPYRAGGAYPVTGLSSSVMSARIAEVLTSLGIVLNRPDGHAKANILPNAIGNAVTSEVLSRCEATVPTDGIGTFQIVGLSQSALEGAIRAEFESAGIALDGPHARAGDLCYAVSVAVTLRINADATITGNWNYAAGSAPVE